MIQNETMFRWCFRNEKKNAEASRRNASCDHCNDTYQDEAPFIYRHRELNDDESPFLNLSYETIDEEVQADILDSNSSEIGSEHKCAFQQDHVNDMDDHRTIQTFLSEPKLTTNLIPSTPAHSTLPLSDQYHMKAITYSKIDSSHIEDSTLTKTTPNLQNDSCVCECTPCKSMLSQDHTVENVIEQTPLTLSHTHHLQRSDELLSNTEPIVEEENVAIQNNEAENDCYLQMNTELQIPIPQTGILTIRSKFIGPEESSQKGFFCSLQKQVLPQVKEFFEGIYETETSAQKHSSSVGEFGSLSQVEDDHEKNNQSHSTRNLPSCMTTLVLEKCHVNKAPLQVIQQPSDLGKQVDVSDQSFESTSKCSIAESDLLFEGRNEGFLSEKDKGEISDLWRKSDEITSETFTLIFQADENSITLDEEKLDDIDRTSNPSICESDQESPELVRHEYSKDTEKMPWIVSSPNHDTHYSSRNAWISETINNEHIIDVSTIHSLSRQTTSSSQSDTTFFDIEEFELNSKSEIDTISDQSDTSSLALSVARLASEESCDKEQANSDDFVEKEEEEEEEDYIVGAYTLMDLSESSESASSSQANEESKEVKQTYLISKHEQQHVFAEVDDAFGTVEPRIATEEEQLAEVETKLSTNHVTDMLDDTNDACFWVEHSKTSEILNQSISLHNETHSTSNIIKEENENKVNLRDDFTPFSTNAVSFSTVGRSTFPQLIDVIYLPFKRQRESDRFLSTPPRMKTQIGDNLVNTPDTHELSLSSMEDELSVVEVVHDELNSPIKKDYDLLERSWQILYYTVLKIVCFAARKSATLLLFLSQVVIAVIFLTVMYTFLKDDQGLSNSHHLKTMYSPAGIY